MLIRMEAGAIVSHDNTVDSRVVVVDESIGIALLEERQHLLYERGTVGCPLAVG